MAQRELDMFKWKFKPIVTDYNQIHKDIEYLWTQLEESV